VTDKISIKSRNKQEDKCEHVITFKAKLVTTTTVNLKITGML